MRTEILGNYVKGGMEIYNIGFFLAFYDGIIYQCLSYVILCYSTE